MESEGIVTGKYNGIDVKMVDKISQIVKYVTKYVTKMKELNFNKSELLSS